mmetsp:Transcript_2024/g.5338  ORF Transcript_2024/g.5338 Transcript_2024/m.5338 type:complete len:843 (-) Transcript_2024:824-3352(-)
MHACASRPRSGHTPSRNPTPCDAMRATNDACASVPVRFDSIGFRPATLHSLLLRDGVEGGEVLLHPAGLEAPDVARGPEVVRVQRAEPPAGDRLAPPEDGRPGLGDGHVVVLRLDPPRAEGLLAVRAVAPLVDQDGVPGPGGLEGGVLPEEGGGVDRVIEEGLLDLLLPLELLALPDELPLGLPFLLPGVSRMAARHVPLPEGRVGRVVDQKGLQIAQGHDGGGGVWAVPLTGLSLLLVGDGLRLVEADVPGNDGPALALGEHPYVVGAPLDDGRGDLVGVDAGTGGHLELRHVDPPLTAIRGADGIVGPVGLETALDGRLGGGLVAQAGDAPGPAQGVVDPGQLEGVLADLPCGGVEEVAVHAPLGDLGVFLADVRHPHEGRDQEGADGGVGDHDGGLLRRLAALFIVLVVDGGRGARGDVRRGLQEGVDRPESDERGPLEPHVQIVVIAAHQVGMGPLDGGVLDVGTVVAAAAAHVRRCEDEVLGAPLHEAGLEVVADFGGINGRNHDDLDGTGPLFHLRGPLLDQREIADLAPAVGHQRVHPLRPAGVDGLAHQDLYARGDLVGGAHGVDLGELPLDVHGGRLLFGLPFLRALGVGTGGRRCFPQHRGAPAGAHRVQGEQDTAPVGAVNDVLVLGGILVADVPFLPQRRGGIGPRRASHGQAVLQQPVLHGVLVRPRLGLVGLARFAAVPHAVLLRSPEELGREPGGGDAGIVAALEVIGLSAGFAEPVKVFLQRTRVLEPVLDLLRGGVVEELLARREVRVEVVHVGRDHGPHDGRQAAVSLPVVIDGGIVEGRRPGMLAEAGVVVVAVAVAMIGVGHQRGVQYRSRQDAFGKHHVSR